MKEDRRLLSPPAEKFDFQALAGLLEQTHRQSQLAQTQRFRGSSATNLRKFREFYIATPIQQTLSVEFSLLAKTKEEQPEIIDDLASPLALSAGFIDIAASIFGKLTESLKLAWSHYVALLTVSVGVK